MYCFSLPWKLLQESLNPQDCVRLLSGLREAGFVSGESFLIIHPEYTFRWAHDFAPSGWGINLNKIIHTYPCIMFNFVLTFPYNLLILNLQGSCTGHSSVGPLHCVPPTQHLTIPRPGPKWWSPPTMDPGNGLPL